jgi:hypothetical protein
VLLAGITPASKPAFRWFKLIGSPLFSINSMQDVVRLMERVRATEVPPPALAAT